jgi:hypothetical protein
MAALLKLQPADEIVAGIKGACGQDTRVHVHDGCDPVRERRKGLPPLKRKVPAVKAAAGEGVRVGSGGFGVE